jgi:hypothetical protein
MIDVIPGQVMQKQRRKIDIINEILEECILAFPVSSFVISLYQRYQLMGSLSKKQLQGLYGKAASIKGLAPGKLATLEAIINRMPTRYKSALPPSKPLFEKDSATGELISKILSKLPGHKRVLFLKAKYDNNEPLSTADIDDLIRFEKLSEKK